MAIVTPSIVPTRWVATDRLAFLKARASADGSVIAVIDEVTIPASTASATLIGLHPFQKGAALVGFTIQTAAQGTSVTFDLGYQYYDTDTGTSQLNGYVAASTTAAAGGVIGLPTVGTALNDKTLGNGWYVIRTGGATTTGPGLVKFQLLLAYGL